MIGWLLPNPLEFAPLQYPQQRDLRFHRKFANFVQEDRPAIRCFKSAQASLQCAREGALLVTEKLGSDQRLWDCGAVDIIC